MSRAKAQTIVAVRQKKVFRVHDNIWTEGEKLIIQTTEYGDLVLPIKPCSYMSGTIAQIDLGEIEHEGRKAWVSLSAGGKVALSSICYLPFARLRLQFYWPMTHVFDVRNYNVRIERHRVFNTERIPEMPRHIYAQREFNPVQLELF